MPWDLGSRGTCQVGGNVSTNAGGLNVVKKGLIRSYVLGMEVVLPNG
jgi:FAD/FMN-containing dehydrogenase